MIALRSLVFNIAFYVNLIVLMILGLPAMFFGRHGVFFMARTWAVSSLWLLEKICGLRVEFRGVERLPEGGYILAAKHQSFLETFALVTKTPDFAIILKRQLMFIPRGTRRCTSTAWRFSTKRRERPACQWRSTPACSGGGAGFCASPGRR
jgi:1-acyl-sn-glycerol-3-phosphate acyltransferase